MCADKPITFERFLKSVSSIHDKQRFQQKQIDHIFIKTGQLSVLTRLDLDEVLYISGFANYAEIHTSKERLIAYLTLIELLEVLPARRFSRIHRSYIVNGNMIRQINTASIILKKELPIGRSYLRSFRAKRGRSIFTTKR